MALSTVIVTGSVLNGATLPHGARIAFAPTSDLTDLAGENFISSDPVIAEPDEYTGEFTAVLVATDNPNIFPLGWLWAVTVTIGNQSASFTTGLPSSPATVDITDLMPSGFTVASGAAGFGPVSVPGITYLPASGGTASGTVTLGGTPPLRIPGGTAGEILTSDATGNAGWAVIPGATSSAAGAVELTADLAGTATAPHVVATHLASPLPVLQGGTNSSTQNWVDLTTTQNVAGAKTFTGTVAFTGAGAEVTVPTPANPSDAVTKAYADSIAVGLSVQAAAAAASVGTESYTYTISGGNVTAISSTTIDGVTLTAGQYVLIKDAPATTGSTGSANSSQPGNGLYVVNSASGSLSVSRASGMSGSSTPIGAFVFVGAGTVNAGRGYVVTTPAAGSGAFTYGSGAIQWTQFSSGSTLTADGTTLTQSGSVLSLATPVTIARGGTFAITAAGALANLGGAAFGTTGGGDLGGTSAAPTVAKIQGTTIAAPPGGTTSFLRGDGTWTAPPSSDWINAVTQYGADNTGGSAAHTAIQNALNAAPRGGTVYLPAGTYITARPIIIPPTVSLVGSGRSLAYDGGSQPMTQASPVLVPTSGFASQSYNGQAVQGVLAVLGITLNGGGYLDTPFSYTATGSPPTFTATGSAYANNAQVVLSGGTPPTGLTNGTIYYVTGVSGATFQLAASYGSITAIGSSGGSGTVQREFGSANQTVRNITINGKGSTAGTNGIEAWGAVWGVKLEDVGIFHMPNCGIFTTKTTFGSDTAHYPDFWQMIGCHIAASGSDGLSMTSIGDSYFVASESTGNIGNGWTLSGDNIKMTACKAEYNSGSGLVISRGGASRPILISGFGTDGNNHYGIQLTGAGAGPVALSGCGLNYDGQNNGTGGNYAALSITGGAHVTATGLHITTGIGGASHLFPQYGIQTPSTFTGSLQIENSEIYGGSAALNLSAATTATGTVRFGPNVLTGSGDWAAQSLANVVRAPSPQATSHQYAKYWSPSTGGGGNWVTSTAQQPRESMPWYAVSGSPTIASGQMLCAVIPVMPGDLISNLGFVVGGTAASLTAGGSGPHWWTALYTTGGAALIGQSADQGAALLSANTPHLLTLTATAPFTIPYLVPAGVYSLLGVVMVNSNGGTQPTLRGISQQAVLNGGSGDLFPGSTTYAATVGAAGSNGGVSPPAGPLTLAVATSFAYLGAC